MRMQYHTDLLIFFTKVLSGTLSLIAQWISSFTLIHFNAILVKKNILLYFIIYYEIYNLTAYLKSPLQMREHMLKLL